MGKHHFLFVLLIKRLLFCVLEKLRFSEIYPSSTAEQKFEGDVRVRTKSHLPKECSGDTTGQRALGRARVPETLPVQRGIERAPKPEPEPRGTLAWEWRQSWRKGSPHGHLPKKSRRDTMGSESARENTRASSRAST